MFQKHRDEAPIVVARPYPEAGKYLDFLYPVYARRPPAAALFVKSDDVPFWQPEAEGSYCADS